jgi:hypothetical protein
MLVYSSGRLFFLLCYKKGIQYNTTVVFYQSIREFAEKWVKAIEHEGLYFEY